MAKKLNITAAQANGTTEPKINPMDYKGTMVKALNWYNVQKDRKDRIAYAKAFAKKRKFVITEISDSELSMIGAVCRLIDCGEPVDEADVERIELVFKSKQPKKTRKKVVAKPVVVAPKPKKDPEETAMEIALPLCERVSAHVDQYIESSAQGVINDFNFDFLKATSNKRAVAIVKEHIECEARDFLSDDPDVLECYNYLPKRKFNNLTNFFKKLIEAAEKQTLQAKVVKVRKVKPKPPTKVVERLKYLLETEDFGGLKSIHPTKIVGASQVVLFNTKNRWLIVVNAASPDGLTVKGTTIANYDPEKTIRKTLRKPEVDLPNFINAAKSVVNGQFKLLKSAEKTLTPRCNEHIIILNVK